MYQFRSLLVIMYFLNNFYLIKLQFLTQNRVWKRWKHILVALLRYGVLNTNSVDHLAFQGDYWRPRRVNFCFFTNHFALVGDIVLDWELERPKSKIVSVLRESVNILYKSLGDALNLHGLVGIIFLVPPVLKEGTRNWLPSFFRVTWWPLLLVYVYNLDIGVESVMVGLLLRQTG